MSPQHGASFDCRWTEQPLHMEGSSKYTEQTVSAWGLGTGEQPCTMTTMMLHTATDKAM